MIAEVRHLGNRTGIAPEGGDAVGGRHAGFALSLIGAPDPSLFGAVLPGATDGLLAHTRTLAVAGDERELRCRADVVAGDLARATGERLAAIRAAGDPDGIFA